MSMVRRLPADKDTDARVRDIWSVIVVTYKLPPQ